MVKKIVRRHFLFVKGLQNTQKCNLCSFTLKSLSTMHYDTPNSKRTA